MNVKTQLLSALENNRGEYLSGAALAVELHVSRNAVWKAVNQLKADGYRIDAVPNRGYCLPDDTDILSVQSVMRHLGENAGPYRISACKAVDSTNTALKALAAAGGAEGLVLIAGEQSAGRGRMGRGFYSPPGTGLYMSLLLRPNAPAEEAQMITIAAAVAVAEAIGEVSGRWAHIKWVNDVLLDGKKVCGILTEAALDMESGGLEYAVLGIGINVTQPAGGFPWPLGETAGAVFEEGAGAPDVRSRLAARVLERFWAHYLALGSRAFMQAYRDRSVVTGREIQILGSRQERALALAIDDRGRLLVRLASGEEAALNSGEVSIQNI